MTKMMIVRYLSYFPFFILYSFFLVFFPLFYCNTIYLIWSIQFDLIPLMNEYNMNIASVVYQMVQICAKNLASDYTNLIQINRTWIDTLCFTHTYPYICLNVLLLTAQDMVSNHNRKYISTPNKRVLHWKLFGSAMPTFRFAFHFICVFRFHFSFSVTFATKCE